MDGTEAGGCNRSADGLVCSSRRPLPLVTDRHHNTHLFAMNKPDAVLRSAVQDTPASQVVLLAALQAGLALLYTLLLTQGVLG